jgi:branched-chain amino acid transport system ATP-binding protein
MLKLEALSVVFMLCIDIEVAGKIITLIGANGAGKSTMFNSIVGLVKRSSGKILWNNEDISGKDTKDIVSSGLDPRRPSFPTSH